MIYSVPKGNYYGTSISDAGNRRISSVSIQRFPRGFRNTGNRERWEVLRTATGLACSDPRSGGYHSAQNIPSAVSDSPGSGRGICQRCPGATEPRAAQGRPIREGGGPERGPSFSVSSEIRPTPMHIQRLAREGPGVHDPCCKPADKKNGRICSPASGSRIRLSDRLARAFGPHMLDMA